MTNPYQHGSPGFLPDSSMPSGLSGIGQRGSSYASVVTGGPGASASSLPRTGGFSHLLNPLPDSSDGNSFPGRFYDGDAQRSGSLHHNGAGWAARNPPLPSFSRAFDIFMRPPMMEGQATGSNGASGGGSSFFKPSYLLGSTYMQKLEEAHRARVLAQREGQTSVGQSMGSGLPSNGSSLSLHGGKLSPAPQRAGMAFDVIEKPPPFEDEDSVHPLPSRWNKDDKFGGLEVQSDGQEVRYTGHRSSGEREHEACSIRADHYIPPQCGIYYYEVTILSRKRDETTIGVGLSSKTVALSRPPGWEPESWGYHGDDGHCYSSHNSGKHYGPAFTTGDTIGCGVNFRLGTVFFTKNGTFLGVAFRDVKGKLFPSVGLKKNSEHIRANFGQTPFVFDIDGMMQRERDRMKADIAITSTVNLAPAKNETELIQQLVLQFLQHDGYVETARAFAEEIQSEKQALNLDPNVEIEGINITDDEDANNRQRIRRAVLEGDIDKALKYTNAYYPQVLRDNEHVYFRLRCRKFIEMVRREAETNLQSEGRNNGHFSTDLDMEIDDGAEWAPSAEKMNMTEEDLSPAQRLTEQAIDYGQALQAEYRNDPRLEVRNALTDIFSLMAYPNPLKEKDVAHLLDRKGRVAVAEELNSAILQSLGKSSRAALETLYAQTSVLLEDLRQDGGPGTFVNIQSVIDDIPKSQPF